jgi:hypothetical protein
VCAAPRRSRCSVCMLWLLLLPRAVHTTASAALTRRTLVACSNDTGRDGSTAPRVVPRPPLCAASPFPSLCARPRAHMALLPCACVRVRRCMRETRSAGYVVCGCAVCRAALHLSTVQVIRYTDVDAAGRARVGVELSMPRGRCSGEVDGEKRFECRCVRVSSV